MSNIREALTYCKNVLWELLVSHERGETQLSADQRADINQAQQYAEEALEDDDELEEGS